VAEVLTSLSTNQVNGFDNTPLFAFATSWFNEIDTWTVSDHIYQPAVVVFNKQWFDSSPPDLQTDAAKACAPKRPAKGRDAVRALTPKLIDKLKEKKITVYEMTPAEKAVFAQKTKKVHAEFRKKTGAKGSQLLDLIEKNK
jgi:TRAP-type C4-dicarboxylate transport system substrate-binding protein